MIQTFLQRYYFKIAYGNTENIYIIVKIQKIIRQWNSRLNTRILDTLE